MLSESLALHNLDLPTDRMALLIQTHRKNGSAYFRITERMAKHNPDLQQKWFSIIQNYTKNGSA
jgi:hypothetical protein